MLTNETSLQSVSTSISISLMKNKINISFSEDDYSESINWTNQSSICFFLFYFFCV